MSTETYSVTVLADRLEEASAALNKLVKKAHRYGCSDLRWELGERRVETTAVRDWDGTVRKVRVELVDLLITGETPRVGNHEFLARVELTPQGNYLDSRPGAMLEARFRTTDGYCQHCNTHRNRKEVYVVRDLDSGRQLQVGRTCLRDYLGIDDPRKVAQRFAFLRESRELGRFGALGGGFLQSLEGLLGLTATCIRLFGWCSKGQAAADASLSPTVGYVDLALGTLAEARQNNCGSLWTKIRQAHNAEDQALAREVIAWVRGLEPNSDYEHNLHLAFSGDYVTDVRRMGLAVSGVAAYQRAQERELRQTKERANSHHVGTVGERLRGVAVVQELCRVVGSSMWGDQVLVKFRDQDGNLYTWFTSRGTGLENGEQATIDATVKGHSEYNGTEETQLTRVRIRS